MGRSYKRIHEQLMTWQYSEHRHIVEKTILKFQHQNNEDKLNQNSKQNKNRQCPPHTE
jgi:hypothetical protein